ncbi:hypothetical protein [Micromonospora radicis]|uniref:hypothetical protein n=1 Tax=Micromonospora radicis TaxID=1894971 RepID=UPI0011C465D7|nr:hypothetical protein [Micromonospora radicis]
MRLPANASGEPDSHVRVECFTEEAAWVLGAEVTFPTAVDGSADSNWILDIPFEDPVVQGPLLVECFGTCRVGEPYPGTVSIDGRPLVEADVDKFRYEHRFPLPTDLPPGLHIVEFAARGQVLNAPIVTGFAAG